MGSETKICRNCKKEFIIGPDDFSFYKKMDVPAPTWCPECRFLRKMTFINQRSLYKGVCGNCKKPLITMYHPDTPFPSWCVKCHLSDVWDACDYGRKYDFSKPFFEQFRELKYSLPHRALDQNERNGTGCEYANFCFSSKNVYLSSEVITSENIKYSDYVFKRSKNCVDSLIVKENDRGYELVQTTNSFNCSFLVESDQCIESHFLYDCSNCVNCCLSSNLRNKSFVLRNKQLSREEYLKALTELRLDTHSGQEEAKGEFKELAKNAIHKYANIKNSVNIIGDFIENSKNLLNCYGVGKGEDLSNVFMAVNTAKDSKDLIFAGKIEQCYEFTNGGRGGNKVRLSLSCGGGCKDMFYSDNCRSSSDCFGCVNLINKQYCILNKQYSKEEYFEFIEKVKKHMDQMPYVDKVGREYGFGEFFPSEISPFSYNESMAFVEFPLSEEKVLSSGYSWRDMESKSYTPTIKSDALPDSINDVSDDILKEIIECPNKGKIENQCTSAFKILPEELDFYRQMNLPLPRYCPNCRYHSRLIWKNPFHFYKRQCMCTSLSHGHESTCTNKFETLFAPDRPEIIYCRDCYQREVY